MKRTDKDFLKLAFEEGSKVTKPYLFGAVVVKDGEIIASDRNHTVEHSDPSAHAEISAIVTACKKLSSRNIPGTTLYASHEPCLMCFMCAAWAEVERIVFSVPASEQDNASYGFKDFSIFEINEKLLKPLKIEQMKI